MADYYCIISIEFYEVISLFHIHTAQNDCYNNNHRQPSHHAVFGVFLCMLCTQTGWHHEAVLNNSIHLPIITLYSYC